nr:MAG TPA: hypothetical protein [Caudoviricetes sp.]DAV79707.1 MAG TPA: hypothetical protein [Caudoviricetes sp.]DAZ06604.1 MAG TPA: hypothetical protein [Caudoviricetes sp.]
MGSFPIFFLFSDFQVVGTFPPGTYIYYVYIYISGMGMCGHPL